MKLVLIEWNDAFGCSADWEELSDEYQPKPGICQSVGWLFRDEPEYKVIVPHIAKLDDSSRKDQGCGDMTIPASAIRRLVELSPVDGAPTC